MRIPASVSTIPIYLGILLFPVGCIPQTPPAQEPVRRAPVCPAPPPPRICKTEAPTLPRGASDKWVKLQYVDAELTDEETRSFQQLSKSGSDIDLQMALLTIATLQLCVKQGKMLDIVATSWGISLAEQFARNPFLQSYDTQVLLLTSLARCGTQNPDLAQQLQIGVSQRQEKWSHLVQLFPQLQNHGVMVAIPPVAPPPVPASTAPVTPIPPGHPQVPALPIHAAAPATIAAPPSSDAQSLEKKLEEVDHLADSTDPQERKKAIEILRSLLNTAPKNQAVYGALTEKLANTCEQAVQQLRALAAKQFQDALPLSEGSTRTEYLRAAQKSLHQAMEYKEAKPKTLQRVEENLHIIEESLHK